MYMTNSSRILRPAIIFGMLVFIGAVIVAIVAFNSMRAERDSVSAPTSVPSQTVPQPSTPAETVAPQPPVTNDIYDEAGAFVASLPVTVIDPSKPLPKYEREAQFGAAWIDVDGNGCDTRNDILKRDFATFQTFRGDCEVQTGVLNDVYTGKTIQFTHTNAFGKKTGDSSAVQIDHVIPLSWAWQNGASQWDEDTRILFANDPVNLKAVEGKQNSAKSDQGPSTWWPSNESYRCTYAVDFTAVLQKYELTIPSADKDALVETLAAC
jgi:hypothetical protein